MALVRVPGTKGKYLANPAGLRAIGRSQEMTDVCMGIASRGAALGREHDPKGEYRAEPRGVRMGWDNEVRNGAVIVQSRPGPDAVKNRVLDQVLRGLESQRGTTRIS